MSMTPGELIELANQLLIVAGRIPGVITVTGPPANTLGAVGSSAFWAEERTWYGPKTAEGWPPGVVVTEGPQGLSAKQIVINAGLLPENATDAQFATWLADAQIDKVQPLVDAAAASATSAASDAGAAQAAATAAGEARTGAEAAQAAVVGAADATAADRLATGVDRAAVADDRSAVEAAALAASGHANDAASAAGVSVAAKDLAEGAASAAGASAAATADDALATAADRQAVADDKAAVAADRAAAEAAAQTATAEAGAASGHADDADTARIAAEAAQAAAEQARDEAEAIAGGDFVTGPTSSTDGRLAVFAGTSGKAVKEGPAFGVGAPGDVLRRSDGDGRYRAAGDVPLAEVTGLGEALSDIDGALTAQAQAIAGKQDALSFTPADAADTYTKGEVDAALEGKADLVDGKVPLEQLPSMPGGGLEVGDILTTARVPGPKYLPADGSSYLRTAWPELSPLLPDGGSVPLTSWVERPVPAGLWTDVIYGGGQFIAVATNSAIAATSPDGITWTQRALPVSTQWRAVAYGNGRYVAVAGGGAVAATSPDGITWTQRALPTTTTWGSLAFGNGVFVAISIANNINIAATSPDGITWTQRALPATQEWRAVAFGAGVFVAVGGLATTAASSINGAVWTQRVMPASGVWTSVAYGDGQFLAITDSTVAASSADGGAWLSRTLPAPPSYWARIRHGSGLFVVVGGANGGAISPDGVAWTDRPLPGASVAWSAVAYGAGVFVSMAYAAASTRAATSNKLTDATLFRVPKIEGHDTAVSYIKGEA